MEPFPHPNPGVAAIVPRLSCGTCGTRRGRGLIVTVDKLKPHVYEIRSRCLRCGAVGHCELTVDTLEPGELDPSAGRPLDPISSDEVIDLRTMPEETFAHEWARVAKSG